MYIFSLHQIFVFIFVCASLVIVFHVALLPFDDGLLLLSVTHPTFQLKCTISLRHSSWMLNKQSMRVVYSKTLFDLTFCTSSTTRDSIQWMNEWMNNVQTEIKFIISKIEKKTYAHITKSNKLISVSTMYISIVIGILKFLHIKTCLSVQYQFEHRW